jgi:hypothetical protein
MPHEKPEDRIARLEAKNGQLERELVTERALHDERVRQLEAEVKRLRALADELR